MSDQKRILVAPLDWGLGHAARCIPIIRYLREKGAEVIVAADHRPLALLRSELEDFDVRFIRFPGYEINYPEKGSMVFKMLRSAPRILRGIQEEHQALQKIIETHDIHAVISDNRFGLWTQKVPCVFITHQLMIKSPFGEKLLHRINSSYINKYDECWIPDNEKENSLSGDLSHKYSLPGNAYYIGPLSRFGNYGYERGMKDPKYDLVAIISGPEPQRTVFERIVTDQVHRISLKALVITGTPEILKRATTGSVAYISHLGTKELYAAIRSASFVLSRPGYSTVMDLAELGKKAIFVPTPGQTEQEYLGEMLMKKGIAYCAPQGKFDLKEALRESEKYTGFVQPPNTGLYRERIDRLLQKL